jgi:hypothetical protein
VPDPSLDAWLGALRRGDAPARIPRQELGSPPGSDEPALEPVLELDFASWPEGARLALEGELERRNMEHLWTGARLVLPERLEMPVDDLVAELTERLARPAALAAETDSSTRWCPACGGEFVATVETCPDCGIQLTEDPVDADEAAVEVETARFDLAGWSDDARLALAHHLSGGWPLFDSGMTAVAMAVGTASYHRQVPPGLPHAWDGTTLVVRVDDVERIGAWVSAVETSIVLRLDPDEDKLAYDVDDMSDESLLLLLDALVGQSIPHELGADGELFVLERDEEVVERILDRVDFPDELPAQDDSELDDPDDGLVAQQVLSDLFEGADRLRHHPGNPDAVLEALEASERLETLPVPFGFHRDEWQGLVDRTLGFRELLLAEQRDEDAVREGADALRDALRPLV